MMSNLDFTLIFNLSDALEDPLPWTKDEIGPEAKRTEKYKFPQNYKTCFDIFSFFWRFIYYSFISG